MHPTTEPLEIVDLLAYQEYKLAVLYNEFAYKFTDYLELWANMVVDELEHRKIVRGLAKFAGPKRKLSFNTSILQVSNIEDQVKVIEEHIENARNNDFMTIKEAFNIAISLEKSLLDQNIFTFYSGDSDVLNNALKILTRDTQEHHLMLIKAAAGIGDEGVGVRDEINDLRVDKVKEEMQ